jgi:methylamine--corrinoid protein Co-methyltransferase
LGGDAPGSAVVNVASFILGNLVCLAHYHICHPIHVRHVATSTRAVLWVTSIVGQAFARNAPAIIVADVYPKAGTGTTELFYETAANAIVNAVTGSHLEGCGSADGKLPHASGLEARLMGEVAHAVTRQGTTLKTANALVLALLQRYEHIFESPDAGVPFDQVYDLNTVQPTEEWLRLYHDAKAELRSLGLEGV